MVAETCDMKEENIFFHATHTHTAFRIVAREDSSIRQSDLTRLYAARMQRYFCDCAVEAFRDLKPCKFLTAKGEAKNVGFIRLYEMKDGSFVTNPAFGNPNILRPRGTQDNSLQLVRIQREGGKEIILVNFGTHPDTLGGCKFFADWPGYVVEFINKHFDQNVHTVMINGCQGNSNHWNKLRPTDFPVRGIDKAKRMARIITGEVLRIYDSAEETEENNRIAAFCEIAKVGKNPHEPEEEELAMKCRELYNEYKDSRHPALVELRQKTGMSVPKANRIYTTLHGPEFYEVPVYGLQIGALGFIGFTGEPFCEIGLAVKEGSKMNVTITSCCTNGSNGYFPSKEAFAVPGGYERNSSKFAHNLEDILADAGKKILAQMEN
jgi:hypothetical protein